jgi:hypothetical protein
MNNSIGAGPIYIIKQAKGSHLYIQEAKPKRSNKGKKRVDRSVVFVGESGCVCVCGGKGDNKTLGLVIFLHKRKKMHNNNATPHVQVHVPMLWKFSFGSYLR